MSNNDNIGSDLQNLQCSLNLLGCRSKKRLQTVHQTQVCVVLSPSLAWGEGFWEAIRHTTEGRRDVRRERGEGVRRWWKQCTMAAMGERYRPQL